MPSVCLPDDLPNFDITPLLISKSTTLLSANFALLILIIWSHQSVRRRVIHTKPPSELPHRS